MYVPSAMLLRKLLLVTLALVLALAPLPLGSNRDWSWSPLGGVVGILLLLQAVSSLPPHSEAFRSFRALTVPALLVAVLAMWALLQVSVYAPISWLNPMRTASEPYLPGPVSHTVALDSELVLTGLLRLLSYVGVFVLAADLAARSRNARFLCGTVVCSAVCYTVYCFVATVANQTSLHTGLALPVPVIHVFSGTFVNRNNYATYAGIVALTALTLALRTDHLRGFRSAKESGAQRWRRWLATLSGKSGFWLGAASILVVGVLQSGSRAGLASLFVGLLAMVLLYARGLNRWWVGAAILLPLGALVLLAPVGTKLLTRAAKLLEHGEVEREHLWLLTLDLISMRPFLGWGMNSFQSVFSIFQPVALEAPFDKAHNTYLELAADIGVPVAVALTLAVALIALRCWHGLWERRRDRELAGLGFIVSIAVAVHSLFDFSLQIPSIAAIYAALLGVGWAQSWSSRMDGEKTRLTSDSLICR